MTTATKWALTVGALALALLVALLPRVGGGPDGSGPPGGGPPGSGTADQGLAAARAKAALPACPPPAREPGRGGPVVERLAGVRVSCLADGSRVDLGAALAGEPTLLNVWATWCEPCREELPLLQAYAAEPGAVRVLTLQVHSSPADGLALLTELGVRLPTAHDGEGARGPARNALRVPPVLPASYFVDADGTVRLVTKPRLFTSVEQIRAAVERLR